MKSAICAAASPSPPRSARHPLRGAIQGCPGKRGVNRLVAGACPARWQFFVYLLVYRTQKEDMRFTPSIFGKLLGPIKRRPFVTLVERHAGDAYVKSFPSWNHLVALVYTSAPRPSACEGWKQVGTPIASIITIWQRFSGALDPVRYEQTATGCSLRRDFQPGGKPTDRQRDVTVRRGEAGRFDAHPAR